MNFSAKQSLTPWAWIPTVYISEGLPYFAVNTLTVLMYVNMGVSISEMAFFTGWLYLPWVIKPFWSPVVDIFKSNRWWMILMQLIIGACFAAVAFFLPTGSFFASTLCIFWMMAFCSATFDISADGYYIKALSSHQQAAYVGVRSTFYRIASIAGQGGLVMLAGYLEQTLDDIPRAWSLVFYALSALFFILSIYHFLILPQTGNNDIYDRKAGHNLLANFLNSFVTFFRRPHIVSGLAFMLLYRLPEALCLKIIQPFLISPRESGGLGLTTTQTGFINGTIGVIALLAGGIAGGLVISKGGLKKWLLPMALCLTLPCILYCFLAMFQPENMMMISSAIFIEQFGYGFGFSAYMLYLLYFARGENSTSHYAFCTAFMALGMMLPGMGAGWLFDNAANLSFFRHTTNEFIGFFWIVMAACIPTLVVTSRLKVDPRFGIKSQ